VRPLFEWWARYQFGADKVADLDRGPYWLLPRDRRWPALEAELREGLGFFWCIDLPMNCRNYLSLQQKQGWAPARVHVIPQLLHGPLVHRGPPVRGHWATSADRLMSRNCPAYRSQRERFVCAGRQRSSAPSAILEMERDRREPVLHGESRGRTSASSWPPSGSAAMTSTSWQTEHFGAAKYPSFGQAIGQLQTINQIRAHCIAASVRGACGAKA